MQSKLDYKTHTKNVDLEPLKNTQHSLTTPQFPETPSETNLHTITPEFYKATVQMNRKLRSYFTHKAMF